MLLIHFKLTHQNVVLQEAKKRLTSKRNPGLGGGWWRHVGEVVNGNSKMSSTSASLPMEHQRAHMWSAIRCPEYDRRVTILELYR